MRNKRIACWMGAAAIAGLLSCVGQAQAAPCSPADLNGDGQIDFADYLAFLNFYDAGDLTVDYNGDGMVDFSDYLEFLNLYDAGCQTCSTTTAELASVPLAAFPFADFSKTFLSTSAVNVTVDPFKYAGLTGKTTNVYITANQTWSAGMALTDVRGGPQSVTWPGGSVSANTTTLTGSTALAFDAGENIGIAYDIVIDENNNGVFDSCDFVDGAGSDAGFYKIRDLVTANAATPVTQVNIVSLPAGWVASGFEAERWYYPTNISSRGQIPLVLISHGNGHNYTWYDHLGLHLASFGMIVISHADNTAPGTGVPTATQSVGDHLNAIISLQSTLGGGILNGHIDQSRLYLIGHSRGGEAVALLYDRLAKGLVVPTGGHPLLINVNNVKYVQSIAPVDFQGTGSPGVMGTNPGPVDFMLLYGSGDGDVCGCPGNPVAWSFDVSERASQRRNIVYIQGADHNVFNCCGSHDFSGPVGTELGRPESQKIQKATTLASIMHWRNGNVPCGEVLWRQYETFKPGSTLPTAIVDLEYKDFGAGRKFIVDDFQTNPATGTSSSGGAVNFTVTNLVEGFMRDNNGTYTWPSTPADPWNGMSRGRTSDNTNGIVFDYDVAATSRNLVFDVVAAGQDTTPYKFLSFRTCQGTQHPLTQGVLADQVFEVELEDNAANTSRIRIDSYGGGIEEVYQRLSGSTGWQNEFETIKIRLADFTANGRTLDLGHITKVRFLFGSDHGTNRGRLGMDDIEFTK